MAISFTKYINITSGVAGSAAVRERELITRIFSSNPLIPTNSFAEFTNASDVGLYFGTGSIEYARAAYYFAFLSKTVNSPQKISFASWVKTAVAANVFGSKNVATLTQLKAITNGSLDLTIGTVTAGATAINLSSAANLAAIATLLQTAIRAASADTNFTAATVTYMAGTNTFNLTGGVVPTSGTIPIAVLNIAGLADIGPLLGWEDVDTIYSYGSAAVSLTNTMITSTNASNNFASFCFVDALTQSQILELATWLSTQNLMYYQMVPVVASGATAMSAALINLAGNAITFAPVLTMPEYPEMLPGMITAATDYDSRNASQNYMYYQSDLTPSVTDDADSDAYDALRINYYGSTQTAGQIINFYQRGVMTGLASSPADINVFANEIWFKSAVGAALLTLFLNVNQVSNNAAGRATLIAIIQSVIAQALFNGVISPQQIFDASQKQVIQNITGDPLAYSQVQNIGYWLDVEFSTIITVDGRTEYEADYTLIYAKNNAIRKVNGTHVLI